MKTLKDFTPEIQAKIPQYIKNGLNGVFDGTKYNNFNLEDATKAINWNYEKCGFKKPNVLVAENPYEIILMYKLLLQKNKVENINEIIKKISNIDMYLFTLNVYSQSYYQWYKFIKDEFKLPLTIEKEFEECFDLQNKSGIYCALFLEEICILSKYPKKIHRNAQNNLHNISGQAVEWGYSSEESKFDCYYINGRNIPIEQFLKAFNNKITKEDWLSEKNEDIKAAWFEILGSEKVMKILEAKEIDSCMQVHLNGEIEELKFYKTDFVVPELNEKLAWVKFICPSTKTNYLISVNPKHEKVMDAVLDTCPFYGQEINTSDDYKFTSRG